MNSLYHSLTIVLTIVSLLLFGGCLDQNIGPKHIVRYEGENSVFIPCPLIGLSLPFWEINGIVYEPFSLPPQYMAAPNGLLVPTVTMDMNETTFACYYSTGKQFEVQRSSTGSLTVKKRYDINLDYSHNGNKAERYVHLDNQNIHFDEEYSYLAWKPPSRGLIYLSKVESGHTVDTLSKSKNINKTSIRIANSLARDMYFNVSFLTGKDFMTTYASLNHPVYINDTVITQKLTASYSKSISIEIPTYSDQYPILVFPQNTTGPDCSCPVFLDPQYNRSCVYLFNCHCVNRTVTEFLHSINICNSTKGTLQVYFQNLTHQLNGTRFHFYYYGGGYTEPYYMIYSSSFEIFEVLPEPAVVLLDAETNNIIFYSEQKDGVFLDNYELTVYDITGQQVFDDTFVWSPRENYSVNVNVFSELDICSPYIVSVKTINAFGYSNTNLTINQASAGEVCSCLMRKIIVKLEESTFIDDYSKVLIKVRCHHSYTSDIGLNVMIDGQDAKSIRCTSNNSDVTFSNLDCKRSYNVSAHWRPPVYSNIVKECILSEAEARPSCSEKVILGITIPISFLIITGVITVPILIWGIRKRSN